VFVDPLIKDFVQESTENLDRLDQEFVQLEGDPKNSELLGSIFRTIHTIKGSCGFLGFSNLESLSHAGESLLSQMRAGELDLNTTMADALLAMVDSIREILGEIDANGVEGKQNYDELVGRLKKLQLAPAGQPAAVAVECGIAKQKEEAVVVRQKEIAEPAAPQLPVPAAVVAAAPEIVPENSQRVAAKADEAKPAAAVPAEEANSGKARGGKQEGTIRVDVSLLESQMNLVSELALLRNRLLQKSSKTHDHELESAVHGLNLVTSALRKNVMKARMQPVSGLFEKLPRMVRDVSRDLGKSIVLETAGGETELDKTLLEAIKDPVTHILRNSMDHGVETPAQRVAAGKPEAGTIRIRAFHEGGNFHLEIADDGAGINSTRVRDKAIAKGMLTVTQAQKMSEAELQMLIFAAGLSTAEAVTSVSGRGVGMDVVKTNIETIGGRVELESTRGRGTRVELEIPLTLATISALTVISGGCAFAIPQSALVEMLCLDAEETKERTEKIDGVRILRFRGAVLPLISFREEMKLTGEHAVDTGFTRIVVVQTEGRRFAIEVDVIRHNEEIVIKPLAKQFKLIGLFTGATTLGDGSVALILDLAALARRCGMSKLEQARAKPDGKIIAVKRRTLVLLSASHGERMAIPVECVDRLESLADSAREYSGGFEVMQYRGAILRLVQLETLLEEHRSVHRRPEEPREEEGKFPAVVVRGKAGTQVIFEVGRILGIVNVEAEKLTAASRLGVEGSLVIQERVTELLDMESLAAHATAVQALQRQLVHSQVSVDDGR
jgi:two-component system chemotaxis sensor kinase CheA